jgi:transmembrane sensor
MFDDQELMQRISSAGASIDPRLSDRDVERLVAGAARRRRRRRLGRIALTGATAVTVALGLVVLVHRGPDRSQPGVVARHPAPLPTANRPAAERTLSDGSTAHALDPTTEITVAQDTRDRAEVVLAHGRGRFDVKPRPTRTFVVHAGDVTVTVLGTLFTVERVADRVGISVEQGTVQVAWGVGSAILEEGDSGWYPPLVVRALDSRAASQAKTGRATTRPSGRLASPASSHGGPSIPGPGKTEQPESAEQLLSAADSARLSGQAEQGARFLRRLLREHRDDARAPLAAFTLGRMLLIELANPIEAAGAFAEARRLSPHGPLAEAALAREVEALDRAGASVLAKDRAREYLRLYPDGRRAAAVQRMAGIR